MRQRVPALSSASTTPAPTAGPTTWHTRRRSCLRSCRRAAGESARVLTLGELADAPADMTSVVYVGNATTREIAGRMVTPRGYQVRQ